MKKNTFYLYDYQEDKIVGIIRTKRTKEEVEETIAYVKEECYESDFLEDQLFKKGDCLEWLYADDDEIIAW